MAQGMPWISRMWPGVESSFKPGGQSVATKNIPVKPDHLGIPMIFSGWQYAALHGRPGSPPLFFSNTLSTE
jgi:hypothetical protein